MTPSGIAMTIATMVAATASSTVAGTRANTMVLASVPRRYEYPMSPCRSPPI